MMDEGEERARVQGSRTAWSAMLHECLRHLGYDSSVTAKVGWIVEREDILTTLRDLCREFGDNDWPDDAHLGDVIEKHLERHLHAYLDTKES